MSRLTSRAVGKSTAKAYGRHIAEYFGFCEQVGILSVRQGSSDSIELWLASLNKRGLSYPTILSRLSALRHMAKREGLKADCNTGRIQMVLKGIKNSYTPKGKNPVTASHLSRLYRAAAGLPSRFETARFRSVISLAFFGFLRPSEFCSSPAKHQLRVGNIRFAKSNEACYITFGSFKHSNNSKTIRVDDTDGQTVKPVSLLLKYMRLAKGRDKGAPLFNLSLREFRSLLGEMCEAAHIRTHITPHCFRHGGEGRPGRVSRDGRRLGLEPTADGSPMRTPTT